MATMMQAFSDRTFLDDEAKPIVSGRVTFYVHDSNVLADIYTMEGMDYVHADNPQRLDEAGRLSASIFTELGVYDVKVEKYNGNGTFADFDYFEIGIDAKLDQIGRDSVKDIDELMDLDPSVSSQIVTVESYPVRNYLWDPEAIDTADGGVVVDSDVADHGKWLLLWDCPYLPSSVYGVKDGDVTNINALFNYSSVIGSMNIHTPPAIRLEGGAQYNLGGYYVCPKHLAVEPSVRFTGTIALYDDLELLGSQEPGHAYGDFDFLHTGLTAHSSWFKDINDFWHCGADILVVDNVNYFTSAVLSTSVILSGKTVIGPETKVASYANSAYFQVALDSTVPDNFFKATDFVRVTAQGFGDNLFRATGTWDPGLINQGHHVQFDQVPDLDLFQNAQRWVSAMVERRNRLNSVVWNDYTLDLQGRTCSSLRLEETCFTTVKNANINEIIATGYSLALVNVRATVMINSTHPFVLSIRDCDITIPRYWANGLSAFSSVNSDINVAGAEGIDPCNCSLSIYGGTWSGYVKMSEEHCNAYALSKEIAFRNVFISGDFKWKINRIFMAGCTSSNPIDLYPAAGGESFWYNCKLHDNHFTGAFRLWITYWWNEANPHYEVNGSKVKFNSMSITDNRFDCSDQYGIKMTCYHVKSLSYYCCTVPQDQNMGTWTYSGNTGNCPKMTPGTLNNRGNWSHMYEESHLHTQYRRASTNFNLFVPYFYDRSPANLPDVPTQYLNPANPTQQVLATIHGDDWKNSWAFACTWPANGLGTQEQLEDENYNNRFYTELWMTRYDDDVPDWQNVGDGEHAYTTFDVPIV